MAQSVYPVPESGGIPTGITNDRPASPATGDVYYDGTVGFLMIWDGTYWISCSSPASQPSITAEDIGTGIAYGSAQATITFTEGTTGGKKAGFTVSSSTGGYTATSTSLSTFPITVGNNGSWSFTGTAYNGFGTSPASGSVTQTLTTVPQAPTIVSAATTASTDITVTWTLNSNGGKALSAITVTPYLNGTTAGTPQNASTTSSTNMTFTGLTPGSTYTFKVKTTNANGTGLESAATNSVVIPTLVSVEYLVIAGGGGGANRSYRRGGGGGAGGYRTSTLTILKGVNQATTVGAGGASVTNGNNSVFGSITSTGGGYGAYGGAGGPGGSGGGACGAALSENNAGGAASPAGQGNAGGSATVPGMGAGGGGGAGAAGQNGNARGNGTGGNGGSGSASSITGTSVTRGGGGGGGSVSGSGGGAGSGGGGAGAQDSNTPGVGTANTGGGGGGSGIEGGPNGAGGSGIVILRYLTSEGTITIGAGLTGSTATDGSYKVTTLTAGTGNVSWA